MSVVLLHEYIADNMSKPVAADIAGRFSPPGKRMGHAGAIVRGAAGTIDSKWDALKQAGVQILKTPIDVLDWAGVWHLS